MNQDIKIAQLEKDALAHPAPLYLLMGEEPYYIDVVSSFLEEKILSEEEKAFNQTILYGASTSVQEIADTATRFPMGTDRQLIIVREAQDLDSSIDKLQSYASSPASFTTLVLCYKGKNMDKRKSVYKSFAKNGVIFESPRVYESDIPVFIKDTLEKKGIALTQKAMTMMVESLGTDLSRIASEIEKLTLVLPSGSTLSPEAVEKYIGISRDFNNFEMQKAVATRDAAKAIRIAEYFSTSKDGSPIATVAILFGFFSKMILYHNSPDKSPAGVAKALGVNPFFAKDYQTAAQFYNLKQSVRAIDILRTIDLKAKGVDAGNISVYDIYKEMIFSIMNT
ncbi:MAG: DNA polymerase III subunit delta [Flavobacteriales bacterium]|nr:DNA polymerase III subunit delta [Flavobacteriales bacterium]